jgi:hypothetical protein
MWRALLLRTVFSPDGSAAGGAAGAAGAGASFADSLPQDIRGEAAFKDIKTLGGLAKSYLNAQKLIGHPPERLLSLPAGDDPKEWDGVWSKLGRPEAPEKYDLGKPPEGLKESPEFKTAFLKRAHETGLNGKQAKALYDWYATEAIAAGTASRTAAAAKQTEAEAKLKTEWGTAYDQNLTLAKNALRHYGDADLIAALDDGLGNDPRVIRVFAKLGKQLTEDGLVGKTGGADGARLSPAEAQQQINALKADKTFTTAYMDKRAPGHADAVDRMSRLYQQAFPG